jgi:hypothetical protein
LGGAKTAEEDPNIAAAMAAAAGTVAKDSSLEEAVRSEPVSKMGF